MQPTNIQENTHSANIKYFIYTMKFLNNVQNNQLSLDFISNNAYSTTNSIQFWVEVEKDNWMLYTRASIALVALAMFCKYFTKSQSYETQREVQFSLQCSKSRVFPIKALKVLRVESPAGLLLTRLVSKQCLLINCSFMICTYCVTRFY